MVEAIDFHSKLRLLDETPGSTEAGTDAQFGANGTSSLGHLSRMPDGRLSSSFSEGERKAVGTGA